MSFESALAIDTWGMKYSCDLCDFKATFKHALKIPSPRVHQGCISCGTCSYPELTEDHVLTSAFVKIFRIATRNAINKSF